MTVIWSAGLAAVADSCLSTGGSTAVCVHCVGPVVKCHSRLLDTPFIPWRRFDGGVAIDPPPHTPAQ